VISGPSGWVEYRPNAKFLEEHPDYVGVSDIDRRDDGTEVFRFAFADSPSDVELQPGDVIVGQLEEPYYLRTVVSSWTEGHALVVNTDPAEITDAVSEADVHVFVPFKPGEEHVAVALSDVPEEGAPPVENATPDASPIPAPTTDASPQFGSSTNGLTFVDTTLSRNYGWEPFTLAGRQLVHKRIGPAALTLRAAAGSRFRLRGGYLIRLKVTHRRVYFRAEARGGVNLDLNVAADVTGGGNWDQSKQFWPSRGAYPLVRFSIFGIPAYLGLRADVTYGMRGSSGTVTFTTGYHLDRGFVSYVEYNSGWRKGGYGTGAGSRVDPLRARWDHGIPTINGFNVGVRPRLELGLGGTYSRRWAGVTANAGVNVYLNPYANVGLGFSPNSYDLDMCLRGGVGVSADLSAFVRFRVWRWSRTQRFGLGSYSRAWDFFNQCWNARNGSF